MEFLKPQRRHFNTVSWDGASIRVGFQRPFTSSPLMCLPMGTISYHTAVEHSRCCFCWWHFSDTTAPPMMEFPFLNVSSSLFDYLIYIYKCGKLFLLLHGKVKDICMLYRGVQYCRLAYKVAQEQLRKLLEEAEEEEDVFKNSENFSSRSSGSSSHVSGNKTVWDSMQIQLFCCWCSWEVDCTSSWFSLKHNYEQFAYDISHSCHILETQRLTTVRTIGRNKRESPEDVGSACDWQAYSAKQQNIDCLPREFQGKMKRKETQDIFATKFINFHVWNMLFLTVGIVWNAKKTGLSHSTCGNETNCTY